MAISKLRVPGLSRTGTVSLTLCVVILASLFGAPASAHDTAATASVPGQQLETAAAAVEHRCIHDTLPRDRPVLAVPQTAAPASRIAPELPAHLVRSRRNRFGALQTTGSGAGVNNTASIRILVRHLWRDGVVADKYQCLNAGDTVESSVGGPAVKCQSGNVLDSAKAAKLVADVDAAVAFLSKVLYVFPVSGSLKFTRGGACDTTDVPDMAPASDFDPAVGVPNADFVLYVTARPAPPGVLAFASTCLTDEQDRPILGHANWDPLNIDVGAAEASVVIGIHEITHSLGFSTDSFAKFHDPLDLSKRLPADQVIKTEKITRFGSEHTITKMITPKVREVVQRHFGCATLDGAEIEDGGGAGTAGSHWEKRLFDADFMTGSKSAVPVITPVTFAALQDSTWYAVDFDAIPNKLTIGEGLGCEFATGPCSNWPDKYLCSDSTPVPDQVPRCSAERRHKAYCNVCEWNTGRSDCGSGGPPPAHFQYFDNKNLGGRGATGDYCPLVVPYDSSDCENPKHAPTTAARRGEAYGTGLGADRHPARCFAASLARDDTDGTRYPSYPKATACYEWYCKSTTELVIVLAGDNMQVLCTANGLTVDAPAGYAGKLDCPVIADFCSTTSNAIRWPTLDYVTPSSGRKGSTLTIVGTDFSQDTTEVELRTAQGLPFNCSSMNIVASNIINCTLPASYSGTVQVAVIDSVSKFQAVSAPSAFRIDVDTSAELPSNGGGGGGISTDIPFDDIGQGAADAGDAAVGWWKSFNDGCGGTIPCWVWPAVSIAVLVGVCAFCCCKKKADKKKEDQYPDQTKYPPPLAAAGGAAAAGAGYGYNAAGRGMNAARGRGRGGPGMGGAGRGRGRGGGPGRGGGARV
jgi:hypothetical protein